jgi:hypothetical protein
MDAMYDGRVSPEAGTLVRCDTGVGPYHSQTRREPRCERKRRINFSARVCVCHFGFPKN